MDCQRIGAEDIAERYLLGRLTERDRDAYELHFFTCARCFADLQTLRSVQAELERTAPAATTEIAGGRRGRAWMWAAAGALVLVTGGALWTVGRKTAPGGGPTITDLPPVRASQPGADTRAAAVESRVAELARVEPPVFIPLTMRSAEGARASFDNAMAAYATGRYADAATGLELVVSQQPAAANAHFFLGISYLMLDRTEDAIRELRQCLDTRDPGYAADAQFFLAKVFIRQCDREAAAQALEAVTRLNGRRVNEARNLQNALTALSRP